MDCLKRSIVCRFNCPFKTILPNLLRCLFACVILGTTYRYFWIDAADPYKCGALLHQGQWLDPDSTFDKSTLFKKWQPEGCLLYTYKKEDIEHCLHEQKVVLIGDSTIRQIYWAVVSKLGQQRVRAEIEASDKNQRRKDLEFKSAEVTIQFIWDPWLNSTALEHELKNFHHEPSSKEDRINSTGLLLLGAPGLWYARYGEINYFKRFRDAIEDTLPYVEHMPDNESDSSHNQEFIASKESRNLILMAPVQVPHYAYLDPRREETITPEKIDQMNNFLQQLSAHSLLSVPWSYSLMTSDDESEYDRDGVHVVNGIAQNKAEVLLNLRCNFGSVSKGYPYERTCCSSYPHPGSARKLFQYFTMMVTFAFGMRMIYPKTFYSLPSAEIQGAYAVFAWVLLGCYSADRSHLFEKVHKQFRTMEFFLAVVFIAAVGILGIRKSSPGKITHARLQGFLSRDQTEEWKGWMQAFILLYHYSNASTKLEIYKCTRITVASYLFLSGFGHTTNFLQGKSYSLERFAAVVIRLNLLSVSLTYSMGTNYDFYYFPPLVSFWYIVIYSCLRFDNRRNTNPNFLIGKIFVCAFLTTSMTRIPGFFAWFVSPLEHIFRVSWDIEEWRFRLSLDMYIVYVGMIISVLCDRITVLQSKLPTEARHIDGLLQVAIAFNRDFRRGIVVLSVALLLAFGFFASGFHTKEDYNSWQPYISTYPIMCFVVLRNSHQLLRNHYSIVFAWLGRISLETYVLQYHIWLAADSKGLLRIGLFNHGIETAILTPIFLWISWLTADATQKLTHWIVHGTDLDQSPSSSHCWLKCRSDRNSAEIVGCGAEIPHELMKFGPSGWLETHVKSHRLTQWVAEVWHGRWPCDIGNGNTQAVFMSVHEDGESQEVAHLERAPGLFATSARVIRGDLKMRMGLVVLVIWFLNVTY